MLPIAIDQLAASIQSAVIFWIFVALLPLIIVLKARTWEPRLTPDAQIYIALASHERVPAPYAYRILLPLLARFGARLSRRQPRETLGGIGRLGAVGAVAATYALTWTLSDSYVRALIAAYAISFADSFFAYSLRTPWLVDATACALALASVTFALTGHPVAAVALLCSAALAKESWAVLSSAFIACVAPAMWWTMLPALAVLVVIRLVVKPIAADPRRAPWLVDPLRWVWIQKKHRWFDFKTNIGPLGPTPWVLAYYVSESPLKLAVVSIVVLTWAQAHVATDHDRLLAHMLPFVIPVVCVTAPFEVLVVYLVASCYWPFYREG